MRFWLIIFIAAVINLAVSCAMFYAVYATFGGAGLIVGVLLSVLATLITLHAFATHKEDACLAGAL